MASSTAQVSRHLVTEPLARFVASFRWEDVPLHVRHEAKRSLLNFFAVALAGCNDPTIDAAERVYRRFSAGPLATVIGRGERTDILNAAALNAMSANVYDFDDTHMPTIIHPTAPVAPAILALSETTPVSGRDFLLAFLLGVEVECRLGVAISPRHYARGWHITSTCGIFGSAMAAGRLLDLSEAQLGWALGSAASQSSGLVECLGTMAKSVGVGNAARNGLLSALLAQGNFDGSAYPLEGARGFLQVFGESPDMAGITNGLGQSWEILKNTYKPYPCGVVLNPVIEACLKLSGQMDLRPDALQNIESIELTGHSLLRQRTDRPDIQTGRESQVSAQHAVAMALMRGRAGLEDFSDSAVMDPALRMLGAKVKFRDDDSFTIDAARVVINRENAPTIESSVAIARGALGCPLSDQDIETKLRDLCRYGRSDCNPEPLIDAVWALEKLDNANALMRLAAGTALA